MGVMLTQYPELFGALICQNPLLDMWRYQLLLAGASRTAEFGDPDVPADWEFIEKYSPKGGHSGTANNDQAAFPTALAYEFLLRPCSRSSGHAFPTLPAGSRRYDV